MGWFGNFLKLNSDFTIDCRVRIIYENRGSGSEYYAQYQVGNNWKYFKYEHHSLRGPSSTFDKSFSSENQAAEFIENEICKLKPKIIVIKEY